jgi:hypothetical protein
VGDKEFFLKRCNKELSLLGVINQAVCCSFLSSLAERVDVILPSLKKGDLK